MKTLTPYFTLYWKEIKSIYGIAVFLLVAIIVISIFLFSFSIAYAFEPPYLKSLYFVANPLFRFLYAIVFILPVILTFSLNIEKKASTDYLLLSLPVLKFSFILHKFLGVISIGLVLALLCSFSFGFLNVSHSINDPIRIWYSLKTDPIYKQRITERQILSYKSYLSFPYQKILEELSGKRGIPGLFSLLLIKRWFSYLSLIFLFSGIVCLAQGIMGTFKNHRAVIWIAVFVTILTIYTLFIENITFMSIYASGQISVSDIYFRFFAGSLSVLIGLYFYEKYSEI
ncbi:hypothetical protein ACFL1R_12045 [Candidatus Latescibacterota bacterium]